MTRRELLRLFAATLVSYGALPLPMVTRNAHAATAATIFQAAQIASSVLSFMARAANPTVPLLLSISKTLEAMNIKIDAFDQKLDILLTELLDLRTLVESSPQATVLRLYTHEVREPYNAFIELGPENHAQHPTEKYFTQVDEIYKRQKISRRKFIDAHIIHGRKSFEGAIHVALAQDAELVLGSELLRPECFDIQRNIDLYALLNALREYETFFADSLDHVQPQSIVTLKSQFLRKIAARLAELTIYHDTRPYIDYFDNSTVSLTKDSFRNMLAGGEAYLKCKRWLRVCGTASSWNAPMPCPIPIEYSSIGVKFEAAQIVDSVSILEDELKYPFIYTLHADSSCTDGTNVDELTAHKPGSYITEFNTSGELSQRNTEIAQLNTWISAFYKLHFTHAVCRSALDLNRRHQQMLAELLET